MCSSWISFGPTTPKSKRPPNLHAARGPPCRPHVLLCVLWLSPSSSCAPPLCLTCCCVDPQAPHSEGCRPTERMVSGFWRAQRALPPVAVRERLQHRLLCRLPLALQAGGAAPLPSPSSQKNLSLWAGLWHLLQSCQVIAHPVGFISTS